MKIIDIAERPDLFPQALHVFWEQWGNKDNYEFYEDCMRHADKEDIPRFYIALDENEAITGTYALIRNDLNSRQDLHPWLACLYVHPAFRGKGVGADLLEHGIREAGSKGFTNLYLSTDLENYYEKYGWEHIAETYGFSGGSIKVYEKKTGMPGKI